MTYKNPEFVKTLDKILPRIKQECIDGKYRFIEIKIT